MGFFNFLENKKNENRKTEIAKELDYLKYRVDHIAEFQKTDAKPGDDETLEKLEESKKALEEELAGLMG